MLDKDFLKDTHPADRSYYDLRTAIQFTIVNKTFGAKLMKLIMKRRDHNVRLL